MATEADVHPDFGFDRAQWKYGDSLWSLPAVEDGTPGLNGPLILRDAIGIAERQNAAKALEDILPSRNSVGPYHATRRLAESHWIFPGARWRWLYAAVAGIFTRANHAYGFSIEQLIDPLLVASYPVGPGFEWHLDTMTGVTATRKLSMTIPLSDEAVYSGGDLEIAPYGANAASREVGAATVFPSFLCHRVTPVLSGRRVALVAWAHGPRFR